VWEAIGGERRVWEIDMGAYLLIGAPLVLLLTKAGQLILGHIHDKQATSATCYTSLLSSLPNFLCVWVCVGFVCHVCVAFI
jgi:hypothetical protein